MAYAPSAVFRAIERIRNTVGPILNLRSGVTIRAGLQLFHRLDSARPISSLAAYVTALQARPVLVDELYAGRTHRPEGSPMNALAKMGLFRSRDYQREPACLAISSIGRLGMVCAAAGMTVVKTVIEIIISRFTRQPPLFLLSVPL